MLATEGNQSAPVSAGRWQQLGSRVLSGAVLSCVVVVGLAAGHPIIEVILFALAVAGLREWIRMVAEGIPPLLRWLTFAGLAAALLLDVLSSPLVGIVVAFLCAGAIWSLQLATRCVGGRELAPGIPYLAVGPLAFLWLLDRENGFWLAVFLLATIAASDTGAYLVGRLIGGRRLWPLISPGKTWSGAWGGLVFAIITGIILAGPAGYSLPRAGLLAVLISVMGQSGDLFESSIKRRYGVKDSGGAIPGHGGVLDRIDAFLVATPVFAISQVLIVPG